MIKFQRALFFALISCFIFSACESVELDENQAVIHDISSADTLVDLIPEVEASLDVLAKEYLSYLAKLDFASLQELNGNQQVLFSPYLYIDTNFAVQLSFSDVQKGFNSEKKYSWGNYDGTGDPIDLTVKKYFQRFVMDVDYLNDSVEMNIGEVPSRGNSLSNLKALFPKAEFVEFYRGPQDEEMVGMDWRSLILVFEEMNNEMILIAVVHSEWTI